MLLNTGGIIGGMNLMIIKKAYQIDKAMSGGDRGIQTLDTISYRHYLGSIFDHSSIPPDCNSLPIVTFATKACKIVGHPPPDTVMLSLQWN